MAENFALVLDRRPSRRYKSPNLYGPQYTYRYGEPLRNTNGLSAEQLENLDRLIDAVRSDPQFLRATLSGKINLQGAPFVTADVVTCCALLMGHINDVVAAEAGGEPCPPNAELKRRLDFARNASLSQLLEIRQQAAQILNQ